MQSSLWREANKQINAPGVYIFKDQTGKVLYVGKSINVRERLKQHLVSPYDKAKAIVSAAKKIEVIPVSSELEALLVEAKLIKKNLPRYNSAAKDDKHPLYIKITAEVYPKVQTSRKEEGKATYFGPFPSSAAVRSVLRQVRRIFPFHSQNKIGKQPCLYSHIGLCKPCPAYIEQIKDQKSPAMRCSLIKMKEEYKKNIKRIQELLSGKSRSLHKTLGREMKQAARGEDFETAAKIREQIRRLEYITAPYKNPKEYLENPNLLEDIRHNEAKSLYNLLKPHFRRLTYPKRIECFDISHLSGENATSSMVTFTKGESDKNFYRHFKIRTKDSHDDYLMVKETLQRRFRHLDDWGKPDLIIIDGGKGQVGAARLVLKEYAVRIPVIGLAKRLEEIIIPRLHLGGVNLNSKLDVGYVVFRLPLGSPALSLLQRMRDEAHRFARRLHFKLRLRSINLQ